jgi:transcriptional regulator with XRE-family HTH domain
MAQPAHTALLDAEVVEELVAEWSTTVGRTIRKRRKELGFTLETMASLTGLSRQTVHRAERDAATLRDEARHLIAIALGMEVSDLWAPIPAEQLRRRAKAVA